MCIKQICTQYASTFPTMKNTAASLHRGRGYEIGNRKKTTYIQNTLLCFKWSEMLRKNFHVGFLQLF